MWNVFGSWCFFVSRPSQQRLSTPGRAVIQEPLTFAPWPSAVLGGFIDWPLSNTTVARGLPAMMFSNVDLPHSNAGLFLNRRVKKHLHLPLIQNKVIKVSFDTLFQHLSVKMEASYFRALFLKRSFFYFFFWMIRLSMFWHRFACFTCKRV